MPDFDLDTALAVEVPAFPATMVGLRFCGGPERIRLWKWDVEWSDDHGCFVAFALLGPTRQVAGWNRVAKYDSAAGIWRETQYA